MEINKPLSLKDFEKALCELGSQITLESIIEVLKQNKPVWHKCGIKRDDFSAPSYTTSLCLGEREVEYCLNISNYIIKEYSSPYPEGITHQHFVLGLSLSQGVGKYVIPIKRLDSKDVEQVYAGVESGKYGRIMG